MNICGYRYLYLYLLYLFPSSTYLTYLYFLTSSTSSNLPLPPLALPQPPTQSRSIITPKAVDSSSTIYLHLPYIYQYLTSNPYPRVVITNKSPHMRIVPQLLLSQDLLVVTVGGLLLCR